MLLPEQDNLIQVYIILKTETDTKFATKTENDLTKANLKTIIESIDTNALQTEEQFDIVDWGRMTTDQQTIQTLFLQKQSVINIQKNKNTL